MTDEEKKAAEDAAAAAADQEMSAEDEAFLLSINEEDVATLPPEDIARLASLTKNLKTTIHQKNHWKGKATSSEKPPAATPPTETPKSSQAPSPGSTDEDRTARIEFRQEHPELSKEDIAEIFALAKTRKITPEAALETPIVKAMLKDKVDTKEVDDATPKPTQRVGKSPKPVDPSTMDAKAFREYRDNLMRERRR